MRTEDLKILAEIGRAIWTNDSVSDRTTLETLMAVSLLDLAPERKLERAASALLDRALRQGMAANAHANLEALHRPFYRLNPLERFLLIALHSGRWSYGRLARILSILELDEGESAERVETLAWSARVRLASEHSSRSGKPVYPAGARVAGYSCPEYRADRPWTQRFLDEEFASGSERLFLQNHLMACDSCRAALNRCREVYFAVEAVLPRVDSANPLIGTLENACQKGEFLRDPSSRTFGQSLLIFVQRIDVQIAIAALIVLVGYQIFF